MLAVPAKIFPVTEVRVGVTGRLSNVGSAPLFARKNLPSLDDVPCSILASVTASSAIFAVVTFASTIEAVTTALLAS